MSSCHKFGCVFVLALVVVASGPVNDDVRAEQPLQFPHASLAAYPKAVISLKDSRTGKIFYVESDGRRLICLDRDGRPAWGIDVPRAAKVPPREGNLVIRHLKLDGDRLWATCGKGDVVRIDVASGKAEYAGAD